MANFVIDASATLPWCLKDEETSWTIRLLRRLGAGDRAIVPAHGGLERTAHGLAPQADSFRSYRPVLG